MSKNITIIGGGVIGLCCAYYLQKVGYEVTVIEKGDICAGASFGNAGYISPSHFVPLASPGIISQGLRWMLSASSPFYIKPRLDISLIKWLMTFWKKSNSKTVEENVPHLHNILQLSRHLMSDIKEDLGNHFRMAEVGCFMLYKSDETEKHELELAKEAATLGIETRIYNGQEVQDLEPEVEVRTKGGILYPIDCHIHPGDFMRTLKDHLLAHGVKLQLNTEVTGFEKNGSLVSSVVTNKGKFDCGELIIASGSWLPVITKQLGIQMLLQPGKGYSMTFEKVGKNLRHPAILVDRRVAMTPMGADLRMGGTMEISGINNDVLIKRAKAIHAGALDYYPGLDLPFPSIDKIWNGLRPLSPDGLPYIGRHSKYQNLTLAGGHAMVGITLAAATGKLVEEIIGHKPASIDIKAFDVERFH